MYRTVFFNLVLCAVLAIQPPTLLVRDGWCLQAHSGLESRSAAGGQTAEEEEKVPGLRARTQLRFKPAYGPSWKLPVEQVVRRLDVDPVPPCCDVARIHWRRALLPPQSPLGDDDPPLAV